jgi:hypothetical protein
MSFDVFLQCFRGGEHALLPRAVFEEIFSRDAIDPSYPLERVDYPDGSGGSIYGSNDENIDGMMFSHCGGHTFYSRLYEFAHRTRSIIFWPDIRPSLAVTDATVIDDIPFECLETIGPAFVASDYDALMDYIGRPE